MECDWNIRTTITCPPFFVAEWMIDWIGLGGEMYCDLRSDRREFCTTPALDDKTHGRVASWSSVIRHHWAAVVALVGGGGAAEGSQGGFSRGIRAYQTYIESE